MTTDKANQNWMGMLLTDLLERHQTGIYLNQY